MKVILASSWYRLRQKQHMCEIRSSQSSLPCLFSMPLFLLTHQSFTPRDLISWNFCQCCQHASDSAYKIQEFPRWLSGKDSSCKFRRCRSKRSIPWSGRSPGIGNATHSSILAWRILRTEEPGGLYSMGLQRVGHDWTIQHTHTHTHTCMHTCMHMHAHMHAHTYTCMHTHIHAHMRAHIHVHAHAHTHTHTRYHFWSHCCLPLLFPFICLWHSTISHLFSF